MSKALVLGVILFSTANRMFGQTVCDTTLHPKLISNSFQCTWTFFKLTDTIQRIIIRHERNPTGCGVYATASLSIAKTPTDTIRIIDLCNEDSYEIGQKIKIAPRNEPPFQVHIPYYLEYADARGKKYNWRTNSFDQTVLKTTWAQLQPIK